MNRAARAILLAIAIVALVYAGVQLIGHMGGVRGPRVDRFWQWAGGDEATRADLITIQREACPGASFILPTEGFIGLLYADPNGPYSTASPHQGIDIFSNAEPDVVLVYSSAGDMIFT